MGNPPVSSLFFYETANLEIHIQALGLPVHLITLSLFILISWETYIFEIRKTFFEFFQFFLCQCSEFWTLHGLEKLTCYVVLCIACRLCSCLGGGGLRHPIIKRSTSTIRNVVNLVTQCGLSSAQIWDFIWHSYLTWCYPWVKYLYINV